MRVTLWGVRGSLPAPGPETERYGGNTPCVEVRAADGTTLVLDAGSGIRRLGGALAGKLRHIYLLLTHLHMDHVQGLGFFAPLYDPDVEVHIWGPASPTMSLHSRLSRYLSPPLFPVRLRDLPSIVALHEVPGDDFTIGPFRVSTELICHPGPTVGYRISADGATMTYIPDHEPALGVRNFPLAAEWTSGYSLSANSDLLIHDAQYSADEYLHFGGWGHSSMSDTAAFARLVGARHLVPFHHDPIRDDDTLDSMMDHYFSDGSLPFQVTPAREGAVFDLGRTG